MVDGFLHAHHESEDRGCGRWCGTGTPRPVLCWTRSRQTTNESTRSPPHSALLGAGTPTRSASEARAALAEGIDALAAVLFPHLDREVSDAMPVVAASITNAEWHEVEQTYSIKPKSLSQLGMEAHWVLDGIDAEGYDVVVHTVPWLMRAVILRGFAGRYRRAAAGPLGTRPAGAAGGDVVNDSQQERPRRAYQSSRRQLQAVRTRTEVLDAALLLFADRGWAATGMRDVASEAGVSVETVYANFGSKTELLMAAIDVGVVGDAEPVALAERQEFVSLGRGGRAARARAAAHLVTEIHQRNGGMIRALREAAASDPEAARRYREGELRRRADVQEAAVLVAGRPVPDRERDGLWAVTDVETYWLLTELGGWTPDEYEAWLAEVIDKLVPRQARAR